MKKLIFLIVAVFCLASCRSLPEKIEIFVSDVEANYENYTELDWAEKDQKMAEFKLGGSGSAVMKSFKERMRHRSFSIICILLIIIYNIIFNLIMCNSRRNGFRT